MSLEQSKPLYSIVLICKNSANTLQRMFDSIKNHTDRGGEVIVVSTNSSDATMEIALKNGAIAEEVGEKFITVIDADLAQKINEKFVVEDDEPIVKAGAKLFDFASARNYCASLASNDFVVTVDDDEKLKIDVDKFNSLIENGLEQAEYNFTFCFDANGNRLIDFIQCKAYDRRKMEWRGCVHELVSNKEGVTNINRQYLTEDIIYLEHHQEANKDHRGNYIVGLSWDTFMHPEKDRQSHYLGREMLYTQRSKSAIKELKRHIGFNAWRAEAGQSMILIGSAYSQLNDAENELLWYHKAFDFDSQRREALIKIAYWHRHRGNYFATAAYANAALAIPWQDYYANDRSHYKNVPHELLYLAMNKIGDIGASRWHFHQAYKYQPDHPQYIKDSKEILGFQLSSVQGWMSAIEQEFLHSLGGRGYKKIVEAGAWKGRGTGAIAQGAPDAQIFCVDTWGGSASELDSTNWMAKQEDVYAQFLENTKQYKNITPIRKPSLEAAKDFEDGSLDCVFIDMSHTYQDVVDDINSWVPKIRKGGCACGHDWMHGTWQQVVEAVTDTLGVPVELHDTIWVHYIK